MRRGFRLRKPLVGLAVELCEVGERPGREEGVSDVANSALDATLFVAARDGYRSRLEAVVRGELEQSGIEADWSGGCDWDVLAVLAGAPPVDECPDIRP